MGYTSQPNNRRWGLPVGLLALILMMVLIGTAMAPTPAMALTINCGECHSNPPRDSDSEGGCVRQTTKSHPDHASSDVTTCDRCHPSVSGLASKHQNGFTNVSASGLVYNQGNSTCTKACHKNQTATWGGSGANCNICHFRSGAFGSYTMSGLHATPGRTYMHFSSAIKVVDNTKTITCNNCHPAVPFANNTTGPRAHIATPTTQFKARADMSLAHTYVSVTGIGYSKKSTAAAGTCALSCHNNAGDPFGNYTIYFKPGQKKRFGAYQTASWGDNDLKCNECHSTPSQEATFKSITSAVFGSATSAASRNANLRHQKHLFSYKLNPWNYQSEDRNIYCDDCHRTPDINATRGFLHHSTIGQGNSGVISLPVKSQNTRVYFGLRNNGKNKAGITSTFDMNKGTCSNIYCHTLMTSGNWTEEACNSCHGTNDGVNVGSGAPGYRDFSSISVSQYRTFEDYSGGGGAHYTHVTKRGYACHTCHYDGGGDGNAANHHNLSQRTVYRDNVNVGVHPNYWFNNMTSKYDKVTRSCNNVRCHYGSSQNWDCAPVH